MEFAKEWKRWAFVLVPAVGLVELLAHAWQTHDVVTDAEWSAAQAVVKQKLHPEDLLIFAPRWVEPLGREHMGAELATMDRMSYADETRYPRAIEVGIRGKHRPELAGWKVAGVDRAGRVTVTTYENPVYEPVVDDMTQLGRMRVSRVDARGEQDCALQRGAPQTSGTYYPPGVPLPADKFGCAGGGLVAITIMPVLDYTLRRCIYAPPQPGAKLRVRFGAVKLGRALHGSDGLYAESERDRTGAPVALEFHARVTPPNGGPAEDRTLGIVTHRDGEGWRSFELDTTELAGQTADVIADVTSSGRDRQYCFEVTTR